MHNTCRLSVTKNNASEIELPVAKIQLSILCHLQRMVTSCQRS
jgi:hypothetical protein